MSSGRIRRQTDFLKRLLKNPLHLKRANKSQIQFLIECFYNVDKIRFTWNEKRTLRRCIDKMREIGRIRNEEKARQALASDDCGRLVAIIVRAVLGLVGISL